VRSGSEVAKNQDEAQGRMSRNVEGGFRMVSTSESEKYLVL
jgi:hypothetical protein